MKYIVIDKFRNSCKGDSSLLLNERFQGDNMRWYM